MKGKKQLDVILKLLLHDDEILTAVYQPTINARFFVSFLFRRLRTSVYLHGAVSCFLQHVRITQTLVGSIFIVQVKIN
jgi:hypothetical protein